jgi:glycosyltransferase involved in cell wall biosynthesis
MTTFKEDASRLTRSIDSILSQTLSDLELIIVFEKEDSNLQMVQQNRRNERLRLLRNTGEPDRNACHNVGLAAARGQFIARMDSDDISYPQRLERQVTFLRDNPEVGVVGAACRLVDDEGETVGYRRFPTRHDQIVNRMGLVNPLLHPLVLWDRGKVGYNLRYTEFPKDDTRFRIDDLELWLRLAQAGTRFANLSDILMDYHQPKGYKRPVRERRGGVKMRLVHWRLGFSYPLFLLGSLLHAAFGLLPASIVDYTTRRNPLSDRLRSIANA